MRTKEIYRARPEWQLNHPGPCVIFTFESIFSDLLGREVCAPKSVYEYRVEQIKECERKKAEVVGRFRKEGPISRLLNRTQYRSRLDQLYRQLFASEPDGIRADLLGYWLRSDPLLASELTGTRIKFVNQPYQSLEQVVRMGKQVGLAIIEWEDSEPVGHFFHFGLDQSTGEPSDLSDWHPQKIDLDKAIKRGRIEQMVESHRQYAGFSGFLLETDP